MDTDEISLTDIRNHNYLHLIGMVILYYDYVLTFTREVAYIWSKPKLLASWPFFFNRYFSIFADIAVNFGNFTTFQTVHACKQYAFYRQLEIVVAQVIVCAILTLRTYALWGRDRRVVSLILSVAFVLLGVSSWAIADQQSVASIMGGCHVGQPTSAAIRTAVAWECLFAFDTMIFALTLYKSYKEVSRSRIGTLNDLLVLIARDGAIYFAVMATANLANTFTFYFWLPALRGSLSTVASSISVTMMSRVMLNLQERAEAMRRTPVGPLATSSTNDSSTTLLFTSRIDMSLRFAANISSTPAHRTERLSLSTNGHRGDLDEIIELDEMSPEGDPDVV